MSSQFVDFNADGKQDILTATFDGSPHISYGSAKGYAVPVRLKDAAGQRILISSFWNYEAEQHQETGRALGTDSPPKERCISALAFDWDADGDFDLLLGSYENGHLYRQMNEGSNAAPKFTGKNIAVMAGDEVFAVSGKMTSPRLVDWDGDGDMDLIAGSFGDVYNPGAGGGVSLFINQGKVGAPAFAKPQTLIEESRARHTAPVRPDAGLYVDAVDYDGDGDLDLVVGGYSMWKPEGRTLSGAEQAIVRDLEARQSKLRKESLALNRKSNSEIHKATEGMDRKGDEYKAEVTRIRAQYRDETEAFAKASNEIRTQLKKYVTTKKRMPFVWLYRRK